MNNQSLHTFHIPVLGLGYSIDTPLKVARFGISSVVSIIEDELVEKMREYHCGLVGEEWIPITVKDEDFRARRITAYLNLMNRIVQNQVKALKEEPFEPGNDICKYFELLPGDSPLKDLYNRMLVTDVPEKILLQSVLREAIVPGSIDANIMSKVDNLATASDGSQLPPEFSDALAAFRGFARSDLHASIVLSAGYNPRLYNYISSFDDFFPDDHGATKKKIILKVSDYRSALVQGKLLAKKGIWVSEFRIESGLNCGGHAFATDGYLLGPILEEFKEKRSALRNELFSICNNAILEKGKTPFPAMPAQKITVQGGIGTASEDRFLRDYYGMDGTGWGSPFLLVPEATNVDNETLHSMAEAQKDDYYLSNASPLGVPFNNFRKSSAEAQRKERIMKGRPGSPCYKKFLASDTEFTAAPICLAARQYQDLKIKQLSDKNLPAEQLAEAVAGIVEKDCLCEGLGASALLKAGMNPSHNLKAVTICPGPNLAYFSGVFTLREMVDHIYGRANILNSLLRPNMFVNEAELYISYLRKSIARSFESFSEKQQKYFAAFRENLLTGISYYVKLAGGLVPFDTDYYSKMLEQLDDQRMRIDAIAVPATR